MKINTVKFTTLKNNLNCKRVTRKFMLNLANKIYDPKSRRFLRLCEGSLQNGLDPTNKKRAMHCGLGELYFAMTGVEPAKTLIDEDDVINLAVELSPLKGNHEATIKRIKKGVNDLGLPVDLEGRLLSIIDSELNFSTNQNEYRGNDPSLEGKFRTILSQIPDVNDDCEGNNCTIEAFRKRSKSVAALLRRAARLIPE